MAKKTRVEDIDSNFIINSFRRDDMSIPPEARTNGVESEKQEESEDEAPMGKEADKEEEQKTEEMPTRRRRSAQKVIGQPSIVCQQGDDEKGRHSSMFLSRASS